MLRNSVSKSLVSKYSDLLNFIALEFKVDVIKLEAVENKIIIETYAQIKCKILG